MCCFKSRDAEFSVEVGAPDGTSAWEKTWTAAGLTVGSHGNVLELTAPGEWRIEVKATASDLTLDATWFVER